MNLLFKIEKSETETKEQKQAYKLWNEWVDIRQKVRCMQVFTQEQQIIKDAILKPRKPNYIKTQNLYKKLLTMITTYTQLNDKKARLQFLLNIDETRYLSEKEINEVASLQKQIDEFEQNTNQ